VGCATLCAKSEVMLMWGEGGVKMLEKRDDVVCGWSKN